MRLFADHIKSTIFLIIYFTWWALFFFWFNSGASDSLESCGAGNGALVMITLIIGSVFALTFSILTITNNGQRRIDYLLFLGMTLFPVILIIFFLNIF